MKRRAFTALALTVLLAGAAHPVLAQDSTKISITAQDMPVRSALESLFKQADIKNYVLENDVTGLVTLTLTEQPLEQALKLVMRANPIPLTYSKQDGVWIIKTRKAWVAPPAPSEPSTPETPEAPKAPHFERLTLTYLDPADLEKILPGIITIPQFTRQRNGQGFSSGNGLLGNSTGRAGLGQRGQGMQGRGSGTNGGG